MSDRGPSEVGEGQAGKCVKTFRYRVRDKHAARLNRMARAASFVWNFCNETQRTAVQRGAKWPTHFDLSHLTIGTSKELDLPSKAIDLVCKQYVASRRQSGRRLLRFRGQRNLGWVPLRWDQLGATATGFRFRRGDLDVWLTRPLPAGWRMKDGSSFSADARGRWYVNVVVEFPRPESDGHARPDVGIDLGLKALATLSTGEAVEPTRAFRSGVERLSVAKRAHHKRQAAGANARIANQRRDALHKLSTRLVRTFGGIYVGGVSPSWLAKTRLAKSVSDAGWSSLRWMLQYKSDYAGIVYREVNEAGSTQTCSDCGLVGGPKGRKGLVVRGWACSGCGVVHDRDVNAAVNILRWGRPSPTGAVALQATEAPTSARAES